MKSKRTGLSEPTHHATNVWRMGTVIKVALAGSKRDAVMMISAIITREDEGDDNLYALLTPHSRVQAPAQEVACELIRGPGQSRLELGTLMPSSDVLGQDSEKLGFFVLRIERMALFGGPRPIAKSIVIVKNFRNSIWGSGSFKVRRVNDAAVIESRSKKNGNRYVCNINRKGRVSAEVEDVIIPDEVTRLEYNYCGLVTRGRNRPLAEPRALGAPVISESGALSAIIVGACENETLVFPIEELCRDRSIAFVTLGEDWPKVRTTI